MSVRDRGRKKASGCVHTKNTDKGISRTYLSMQQYIREQLCHCCCKIDPAGTSLKAGLHQACSHYVLKNMTEQAETQWQGSGRCRDVIQSG